MPDVTNQAKSTACNLNSFADIDKLFNRELLNNPLVASVWNAGLWHKLDEVQRLKWIVCIFCEWQPDAFKKRYEEIMSNPFNFLNPRKYNRETN